MRLNSQRLFDFALIAATEAGKAIKPLVDYLNSNIEQLIRAVDGQLTLEENIKGQIINVSLTHGVSTAVAVNSRDVNGLICLQVTGDAMSSFSWSFDSKDNFNVTAYFKSGSGKKACRFFLFLS